MVQIEEPRESRRGHLENKEASGIPDWENVVEHTPEKEMRCHAVHINEEHEQRAAQGRPAARKCPISLIIGDGMGGQVVTDTHNTHRNITRRQPPER